MEISILAGQVASSNIDSFTAATTAEEATKRGAKKWSVCKKGFLTSLFRRWFSTKKAPWDGVMTTISAYF